MGSRVSDKNYVEIIGRAGKDATLRFTKTGTAVSNVSVATGGGDKRDGGTFPTMWHNIVAWKEQAEALAKAKKGDLIEIVGRITYSSYEKDGVEKQKTEITASEVIIHLNARVAKQE